MSIRRVIDRCSAAMSFITDACGWWAPALPGALEHVDEVGDDGGPAHGERDVVGLLLG